MGPQLLRDRRLALLVAGQALNGMGSWCAIVALPIVGLAAAAVGVQVAGVAFAVVPIVGGLLTLWRVRQDGPFTPPEPDPRLLSV